MVDSLTPNPEYDKPGYCALCHNLVAEFEGGVVRKVLPNFTTAEFVLDDGSKMRVALCQDCNLSVKEEQVINIMESVYKGWVWEIENILQWPKDKKDDYLSRYGERYIVARNDIEWLRETVERKVGKDNMKGIVHVMEDKEAKAKEAKKVHP